MIELLVAIAVLSIGVLGVFTLMNSGMVQIQRAAAISTAAALAESRMENFRAVKFTAIGLDDTAVGSAGSVYSGDSAYKTDSPTTTAQTALSSAGTSLTVASTSGFPASPPFRIKIDSEILLVNAVSGTTWTISRGFDSTVPASHAAGATVSQKQRAHLPVCGASPCTTTVPVETVTGADGSSYKVYTYVTWQLVQSSSGTTGRNTKRVTIVVRHPTTNVILARVASTFDEATGL
jgi:Tfp pilus assembly protein PilV